MRRVFIDTSHFIASIIPRDAFHNTARRVANELTGARFVTAEWIFIELLDHVCDLGPGARAAGLALIDEVRREANITIVPYASELFERGIDLYRRRQDKSYSLTDCMSMVVCAEQEIREVLTTDHDFEQEGFTILLKR